MIVHVLDREEWQVATVGESLATHTEQIAGLRTDVDVANVAILALHRRLDSRPSWAVCTLLSIMGSTIGAMGMFIASHSFT